MKKADAHLQTEYVCMICKVKVKVSHSLIAIGTLGARDPLYLGYS